MRASSNFVCQQCGYQSPAQLGRCPNCGSWNSLVETLIDEPETRRSLRGKTRGNVLAPLSIPQIKGKPIERITSGVEELDRVLGGGILKGACVLLSGDPGIGKSTILLQVALNLSASGLKILYVSGEESVEQIKLRVDRLLGKEELKNLDNFYLLAETGVYDIVATLESIRPDLFVIDSIQTMEADTLSGMAGSVGQVREAAGAFLSFAKKNHVPLFLVGHVTKEGLIAGPGVLSHIVDTVLFLEGERFQSLRILRSLKNRFGPVDEVGVLEIGPNGFKEVKDPNKLFLSSRGKFSGKAIALTIEGTRPLLCEIQALVVPTKLAFPKRVVSGLDSRRVELMIAVLQKTLRIPLERFDIFVSTGNGIKIFEPALDLAMCLSIVSSFKNKPLRDCVFIGEVSLLGELREVAQLERRIKEAERLGFTHVISAPRFTNVTEVVRRVLA